MNLTACGLETEIGPIQSLFKTVLYACADKTTAPVIENGLYQLVWICKVWIVSYKNKCFVYSPFLGSIMQSSIFVSKKVQKDLDSLKVLTTIRR